MRPFVVKLVLTLLTFPLANAIVSFAAVSMYSHGVSSNVGVWMEVILGAGMLTLLTLWVLIWRRMVRWSKARIVAVALIGVESVVLLVAATRLEWVEVALLLTTIPFQLVMVCRLSRREHAATLAPWRRNHQSYCPRCMTALVVAAGDCPNCAPAAADDVPTEEPQ